jgi:16S rRNA (guanine527-N7)-methyltransferase
MADSEHPTVENTSAGTLTEALLRHNIDLPANQTARIERYCQLLWDWNSKLNLTRHTDFEKFVSRDLVDSLAFAEFLRPKEKILDLGSGGGVPGIVLAIIRPDLNVTLCDSMTKKTKVLSDIVEKLGIKATVFNVRAEDLLCEARFQTVVIRAVAKLAKMLQWFKPHWDSSMERMLVLKGPSWVEERGEARHFGLLTNLALRKLKSYPFPGTKSESVLLQICAKDRLDGFEPGE